MDPQQTSPRSVSSPPPSPVPEASTSNAMAAGPSGKERATSLSDNLSWASLIKEQHRHLHGAVSSAFTEPALVNVRKSPPRTSSAPDYQDDLRAWKAALEGETAAHRLAAYSTAMHHLATQYWDPAPNTALATSDAHAPTGPHESGQSLPDAPHLAAMGVKRPRGEDGQHQQGAAVDLASAPAASLAKTEAARAPRHYSDRLQYCLDSTASYYLGKVVSTSTHTKLSAETGAQGGDSGEDNGSVASPSKTTLSSSSRSPRQPPHHSTPLIPLHDVTFVQLPGVMAHVVKPLRRAFFDAYGRMATGEEVSQLLHACTPSAGVAASSALTPAAAALPPAQCEEASLVRQLMSTDLTGQTTEQESIWRRCDGTAWAAALRYTRSKCFSSSPPSLSVLDVGSCYGPFCGRSIVRPFPLAAVPLYVTSIDLAPYVDAAQAALPAANSPPSPLVWQGDWLQMKFFAAEDSFRVLDEAEVTGCADEGRVWYRMPPPAAPDGPSAPPREGESTRGTVGRKSEKALSDSAVVSPSDSPAAPTTRPAPFSAVALRLESFDAVYFCLLLSYMPTPRLRFLACLHACLALKEGGLLVIVSTRTQGSRRRNWMQEWVTSLTTIGFRRVQQSTQEKIVGMAFAKECPSKEVWDSWQTTEGRAAWIREMMATPAAETGLRITADDARDRAEI